MKKKLRKKAPKVMLLQSHIREVSPYCSLGLSDSQVYTVEDAVEKLGFGTFQIVVTIFSGLIWVSVNSGSHIYCIDHLHTS